MRESKDREIYIFLSYPLTKFIPTYGTFKVPLPIEKRNCISKGDSCITYRVELESHWGTHVDAPHHFFPNGKKVSEYPADFWVFKHPQVISVKVNEGELLYRDHFKDKILDSTDCLLIHTGFGIFRDHKKYCISNPGIHSEVGQYLRENYPLIRAIGFDFISLSSYKNREEGRKSHRVFLDPVGVNNEILIIEDMDLRLVDGNLDQVIVSPLRIDEWDSSPCTVIGKLR